MQPAVQQILDGTFPIPPDADEYTREFLQLMAELPALHSSGGIPSTITKEDFQSYWKRGKGTDVLIDVWFALRPIRRPLAATFSPRSTLFSPKL